LRKAGRAPSPALSSTRLEAPFQAPRFASTTKTRLRAGVGRGPGFATTDLTLEKTIPLGDRVRFDLRVEAYNLFNRTNFNVPGYTLGAADFGAISSARAARAMQVGARLQF
jgi:hypothetical protein